MTFRQYLLRLIYSPIGLAKAFIHEANEYCRDFEIRHRYPHATLDHSVGLTLDTVIGEHSHIFSQCILNHCKVGNYTYIAHDSILQNVEVGNYCSISYEVYIGLGKHPLDLFSTSTVFYRAKNALGVQVVEENSDFEEYGKIVIGNDVWIGARATILDGVTIGDGAVIATGSIVTKDVPPYAIVAGVPARIIKERATKEEIERYRASQWWNLSPAEALRMMEDSRSHVRP